MMGFGSGNSSTAKTGNNTSGGTGSGRRVFGFGSKAKEANKESMASDTSSTYCAEQISSSTSESTREGSLPSTNKAQLHAMVGSEEGRIVNEITAPGGVRPQPTREELSNFVNVAVSVDSTVVANGLGEKLGESQWQVKLKSLCAMEALCLDARTDYYK